MADTPKSIILRRLAGEGYSESYGILLFYAALVGTDAETLAPESDEELYEWRGHLNGLCAALMCIAMHEAKLDPEKAAAAVHEHIADAARDLGQLDGEG